MTSIPMNPPVSNGGIPLAAWEIRIVPVGRDFPDAEYDAGLAAIADHDVEARIDGILADLRKDPRMRNFRITFDG